MGRRLRSFFFFSRLFSTEVAAEFSQHAVWVGSGHLGEARQNQNVAVLQGALVHRLTEDTRRYLITNTNF